MVPDRRHGGHRRVLAAAIGCLALSVPGEAAETENRAPIAKAGQAVQAKPDRRTESDQQPIPKPTWPVDIEAGEKASRAECGTPEECRAEQRDYSDLHAQWQAANAAMGQYRLATLQTWIAGAATLIAGVGTLFLIWTFKETRRAAVAAARAAEASIEANRISRETYEADQRPWVSVEPEIVSDLSAADKTIGMKVRVTLKNHGKAPATRITAACKLIPIGDDADLQAATKEFCERVRSHRKTKPHFASGVVFPDQEVPREQVATMNRADLALDSFGDIKFSLVSLVPCVAYEWTGDSKIHVSYTIHNLIQINEGKPDRCFVSTMRAVKRERLSLERTSEGFAD
jgi:hypothetical protein